MYSISDRLNALNQQLIILSKLQRMDEEPDIRSHAICKKHSTQNNFGKACHCAHRILSLKEQYNKVNYVEECISCDTCKKKLACNTRTCKARKRLVVSKIQTDLNNDTQMSNNASISMQNSIASQNDPVMEGKQNKSGQVNLSNEPSKPNSNNEMKEPYREKNEQTIPTKEFRQESSANNVRTSNVQVETVHTENTQAEVERNTSQEISEMGEIDYTADDALIKDKKMFERVQKDLANERKRNKELEKKLKSLTCSLNCLKEDSEQRAACLKGALETAEGQTKLAMDLVKQSKNQAQLVQENREELLSENARLQQQIIEVEHRNAILTQERDQLKDKLESLSDDGAKRCEEVEKEVNRMKCAVKEKEDALSKERTEFMNMIVELTNVIKIQKKRICEVTSICSNQQCSLQEKDKELSHTSIMLTEVQNKLEATSCTCSEMKEQIDDLKHCLCDETETSDHLRQELDTLKESHSSEMRIKEKIVEEQIKTISKQRKLLHDSEKMAQQAACEFDELKEDLYNERQKAKALQVTLNKAESKLKNVHPFECKECKSLKAEIEYLKNEKQKALTVAKFTYEKFNHSIKEYQKELASKTEQHRYMAIIIQRKEKEIGCLRSQIYQNHARTIKNMNSYVL